MTAAQHKNKYIDIIKGFAMFSVICAHCNSVLANSPALTSIQSCLVANMGTYGVITLFIISGYLYHGTNLAYVLKKMKRIVPPWFISGTSVFLYVYLRKPPLIISQYLKYLIGQGSYLYYLPILFFFYLLFSVKCFRSKAYLVFFIILGMTYSLKW